MKLVRHQMDPVYQSLPLDTAAGQLRLITILASSTEATFHCTLETASLHDTSDVYNSFRTQSDHAASSPTAVLTAWQNDAEVPSFPPSVRSHRFQWGDYAALSYNWGDSNNAIKIIVNGVSTAVTVNLAAALHRMRETGQFTDRFKLWADALCINQQDIIERGHQVAAMRHYYSSAWSVIAFIGTESDSSDESLELLRSLADISDDREQCDALRNSFMESGQTYHSGPWPAFDALLLRPYFARLWIMQEVAMGGTRTTLYCGQQSISWHKFSRAMRVMHDHLFSFISKDRGWSKWKGRPTVLSNLHRVYKDLWALTLVQESTSLAIGLNRLMEMSNTSLCSDSRDRIYGMLGVMDPRLAHEIVPDYNESIGTVCTRVAQAYVKTYDSLEFLRDCNLWGKSGAPSWAPDWTWPGRARDYRTDDIDPLKQTPPDQPQRRPYRADEGLPFTTPLLQDCVIGCVAIVFDEIDGLGTIRLDERNDPEMIQSQTISCAYGDDVAASENFGVALFADRTSNIDISPCTIFHLPVTMNEAQEQFTSLGWKTLIDTLTYYSRWTSWVECNASLLIAGRPLGTYFGRCLREKSESDLLAAYRAWTRTAIAGARRLITTKAGRVGWAPCARGVAPGPGVEAQRGDVIAVLPRCSTPIALRKTENCMTFKVVGEAYVQGIMHGEVAKMLGNDSLRMERIWLE